MTREDLVGRKFNMLTVVKWHHVNDVWEHYWECVCECGNHSVVVGSKLRRGTTKSCGCWKKLFSRTHGQSGVNITSEYVAYHNMLQRCTNSKNNNYKYYGAKGVSVCDRWKLSFEYFLEDMGKKPSKNHSIERVENLGDYGPGNCIWDIRRNQDRNKRRNNRLEYNGRSEIIKDWADELCVKPPSINYHLSHGKTFDWIYNHFKNKKAA